MSRPRKVIAKVLVEVTAEILLDENGDCEELIEIREPHEVEEVVSVLSVLTTR